MDNELRVTSGTVATIGYDCVFGDGTKKTITVGNFKAADVPNDLKTKITTVMNVPEMRNQIVEDFDTKFVSMAGASFASIGGCTITVTNRNVII